MWKLIVDTIRPLSGVGFGGRGRIVDPGSSTPGYSYLTPVGGRSRGNPGLKLAGCTVSPAPIHIGPPLGVGDAVILVSLDVGELRWSSIFGWD